MPAKILRISVLANKNVSPGEQKLFRVIEMSGHGETKHSVILTASEKGFLRQLRHLPQLENGNIPVTRLRWLENENLVVEYLLHGREGLGAHDKKSSARSSIIRG